MSTPVRSSTAGLPAIVGRTFKATPIKPNKNNLWIEHEMLAQFTTRLIKPQPDREYRVLTNMPAVASKKVHVLISTPPNTSTRQFKNELCNLGWDAFFATHPEYEFWNLADLELEPLVEPTPETFPGNEALFMFSFWQKLDHLRFSDICLPKS